jgi:hypothetical protein
MMTTKDWLGYGIPFGLGALIGAGMKGVTPLAIAAQMTAFAVGGLVIALIAVLVWCIVCFLKGDGRHGTA